MEVDKILSAMRGLLLKAIKILVDMLEMVVVKVHSLIQVSDQLGYLFVGWTPQVTGYLQMKEEIPTTLSSQD